MAVQNVQLTRIFAKFIIRLVNIQLGWVYRDKMPYEYHLALDN